MQGELEEAIAIGYWDSLRMGNKEALAWLYDRYFAVLYNYGRKLGADGSTVEDHIHDLFVDLWRYRASISATTSVKFYFYRSLRRRLVKSPLSATDSIDHTNAAEAPLEDKIVELENQQHQSSQLRHLLRQLPGRQYEAIVLKFYDGLEYHEIAAMLEVNEQSARNLVARAITHLRGTLREGSFTWMLLLATLVSVF